MSSPSEPTVLSQKDGEAYWKERALALEREVANIKTDIIESEERIVDALVQERKARKRAEEDLTQMSEKYEMAKEAMVSLTSKCLQLEVEIHRLSGINKKNDEFMEKLAAQRAADDHCKRALDDEIKKAKLQIRQLMDENGTLALRLEISEGGGI